MDKACLAEEIEHAKKVARVIPVLLKWAEERAENHKSDITEVQESIFALLGNKVEGDFADLASLRTSLFSASASLKMNTNLAATLLRMIDAPWFGRLDFIEDELREAIRVGRASLIDPETRDLLVYDWRAPICSLYYDAEPGPVSYESPGGTVQGEMAAKWMVTFDRGVPVTALASSLALEDELLIDLLGRSSDPRMGDIVTSIQREQNRVIRDERFDVLAVEGPAGSGKTSVALHRVAWLLYRHRKELDAGRVRVLSPNKLFSAYIAQVLPGLGESAAPTFTFAEIAQTHLALPVEPHALRLDRMIADPDGPEARAWRGKAGRATLERVLRYVDGFEPAFRDIRLGRQMIIPAEEMRKLYAEYHVLPPAMRLERLRSFLQRRLLNRRRKIEEAYRKKLFDPNHPEGHAHSVARLSAIEATEPAFAELHRQTTLDSRAILARAMDEGKYLDKREASAEGDAIPAMVASDDAALLLLVCLSLGICRPEGDVRHVVVDEAQDLTPAHLRCLRLLYPNATFTLLGDRRQTLSPGEAPGGEGWLADLPGRNPGYMEMNRAYRSTRQIAEFCARICPAAAFTPVARDGAEPELLSGDGADPVALAMGMIAAGASSAAVITPTVAQARALHVAGGGRAALIDDEDSLAEGIVKILPVSLAKGLEFDAVVADWRAQPGALRSTEDSEARRWLYTACSRALHRLAVVGVEP